MNRKGSYRSDNASAKLLTYSQHNVNRQPSSDTSVAMGLGQCASLRSDLKLWKVCQHVVMFHSDEDAHGGKIEPPQNGSQRSYIMTNNTSAGRIAKYNSSTVQHPDMQGNASSIALVQLIDTAFNHMSRLKVCQS